MILKQVHLKAAKEPLQIRYPEGYEGEKSADEDQDDGEFFITTEPRFLCEDEINLVREYVKTLSYSQELMFTGCTMIDPDDTLLDFDHDQLDALEETQGLPSTRKPPGGGTRQAFERVLLIREKGYEGTGFKSLSGAKE